MENPFQCHRSGVFQRQEGCRPTLGHARSRQWNNQCGGFIQRHFSKSRSKDRQAGRARLAEQKAAAGSTKAGANKRLRVAQGKAPTRPERERRALKVGKGKRESKQRRTAPTAGASARVLRVLNARGSRQTEVPGRQSPPRETPSRRTASRFPVIIATFKRKHRLWKSSRHV